MRKRGTLYIMKKIENLVFRLLNGIREIIYNRKKLVLFICIILMFYVLNGLEWVYYSILPKNIISEFVIAVIKPIVLFLTVIVFGTPRGTHKLSKGFYKIGFHNKEYEIPRLLNRKHLSKETDIEIYTFYSPYLSLMDWENSQDRIETLLGYDILQIKFSKHNKKIINIYIVDLDKFFSKTILWKDEMLVDDDCTLLLGVSAFEKVKINLNNVPHSLVAGGTGSGKTTLFKLCLWQCLLKNMEVYIADFKGGLDFNEIWHKHCKIITLEQDFLDTLISIKTEMNRRRDILVSHSCRNIEEYNNKNDEKLNRIIIACDEVAELLDKTGLKKSTNKEKLELMEKIEEHITSVARLGRAFGVHLILSTQKPSADIINGQIKINLGNRICGSADKILSQMVLENNSALEKIPPNSKGVFINQNAVLFKSFLLDENNLILSKKGV